MPRGTTITEEPRPAEPRRVTADEAWARAVELAARGPEHGPNPRVGCVITDASGRILGEGFHRGAGTAHAEAAALADASERGESVRGATAYVTLEPCNHTGRTGPCTGALIDAEVARVEYAVEDPNPTAAGGAHALRTAGIDARHTPVAAATVLTRRWAESMRLGRPYVIAKWAATLDGRIAAQDGTSVWITGDQAREHAHRLRARVDALVVGTGTVAIDNPQLSARPVGVDAPHQPLRVVVGTRSTDGAAVWRDDNAVAIATHDPRQVLDELHTREVRTAVIEGGATVVTAFLRAGLVDEVHAYIAPVVLGAGPAAVGDLGITTMNAALRGQSVTVTALGADTLVTALLSRGS